MFVDVILAVTWNGIIVMVVKIITSLWFVVHFKIWMSVLNTIIQNCHYYTTSGDIFSPYWSNVNVKSPWAYCLSYEIGQEVNKIKSKNNNTLSLRANIANKICFNKNKNKKQYKEKQYG